ncbi:TFIIH complex subunit tfb5 [Saxophila tyrrhenica]|uniref:General transcription and DNA repair factor IIH subunit TFB5 n=1 Tax=Saxophila tyrrhenica TaxID=1690608 RepID=A0AAV9P1U2_9PEZI|nr:TFIIH complex subunit tfb5 [Saxophila tyrrhenica]
MPRAVGGVLVECDPSIKAIISRINEQHNHDIIIEDIDDEHVLIKKDKHEELKALLKDALRDTVKEAEETSESE